MRIAILILVLGFSSVRVFAQGTVVLLYELDNALTSLCTGGNCIPGGSTVEIHYDIAPVGPGTEDPLVNVGPAASDWNFDSFQTNPDDIGSCGGFFNFSPWATNSAPPAPSGPYYMTIRFGSVTWTSDDAPGAGWAGRSFESGSYEWDPYEWTCRGAPLVLSPNGGETRNLGMADTIRWSGGLVGSWVAIELNREFPTGQWEHLVDSTSNDGLQEVTYTGLPSQTCRIRVTTLQDSLSDMSDGDFALVNYLELTRPTGGENFSVFNPEAITWVSGGLGSVRISVNRSYASGTWESIVDSTANDGEYEWFVTDPLATQCRVRIRLVDDSLSDTSESDFAIIASQGYLAPVRAVQNMVPILNWSAGTIECPDITNGWFRLKNFGSEAIVVFQPLEPPTSEFARVTTCGTFFALAPGQMSACSLQLSYDAFADGETLDTLLIQSDAVNGVDGYVRIPLLGSQVSTPGMPEVVITTEGENARLHWAEVTESVGGCAVDVTRYLVFFSEVHDGPYWFHGFTADTSYTHYGVTTYALSMFYNVIATTATPALIEQIPEGMEMGEATETLKH